MRHRKHKATLDRNSAQRQRLVRNLTRSLILHEKIVTTSARGKVARSLTEKLITIGKKQRLHDRRQILHYLPDNAAVTKIMNILSPRYKDVRGGYLRTTKLSARVGDGAERVLVEFIVK